MEPKRDLKPDQRARLELERAQHALRAALLWWDQVLAAERASGWSTIDPAADGTLRKIVPHTAV